MEAFTSTLRAVFALAFVLGLIMALAYVLKRYAPQFMARLQAKRGQQKRLEVVETLVLDPSRRLVLVRLDDEERLILLGEGHELIEPRPKHTDIKPVEPKAAEPKPVEVKPAAAMPAAKPVQRPTPAQAPPPAAAPKPVQRPTAPAAQTQDPNDDLF